MFPVDISNLLDQFRYHPNAPLIFNSGFFLFLFLGFLAIYMLVYKHKKAHIIYLTLFSFFFYYKSSGIYVLVLLFTTITDYALAKLMYQTPKGLKKELLLILSLVSNLAILAYFKYTNFFIDITNLFWYRDIAPMDIFLPVGVSFFTFQSLSYTIDVYRNELKPVGLLDFAFFVTFFPQMVAGPIVRAKDFLPQIHRPVFVSTEDFGRGVFLFACGLFKKAVISDYISRNFVDRVFEEPLKYTGLENLFGTYGYALQIYCDFSGYTDMAIGIALVLGYHLVPNFDAPYQSASITEFWRRWHISLSTWLRDYLYIPLGGNRLGKIRTYINLLITMLLGGLWHGASMQFVLWGFLHGTALSLEKFFNINSTQRSPLLLHILRVLLTYHFVCFCWIFFRAATFQTALDVLYQIAYDFRPELIGDFIHGYYRVLVFMALGFAFHFVPKSIEQRAQNAVTYLPLLGKALLLVAIIFCVMQVKSSEIQPFIYFQF